MKREIGVTIVLLILLLGSVQVALAAEYDLDSPVGTASEKGIDEVKQSLYFVPASRINNYPQTKLAKELHDAIYISDATGKPKYDFWDTDNIYLRDNRIDESLDEFFARTHQGYNIETQEFMPKYANLYEPNSLVDIYILFNQDLRESDLSDFFIPRSTPYGMESRTLNILGTSVVKKVTVKTTSVGRLPFVNLGKIDIRQLYSDIDLIGKGRTHDYSSEIDNILRSDPLSRLRTPVRFDIFVDANRDLHWSWIGDLYQSNIVSRGWLREEPDAFLYGPVPGFTVRYNPAKLRSSCCLCVKGIYSVVNVFDVYECDEYC
ncbi:hypothetical protein KY326_00940, partial [Candidatus Woesearchaeota archaeon]|nr:hypothetical protein [Candidatus Woesearchaeota archaeon]